MVQQKQKMIACAVASLLLAGPAFAAVEKEKVTSVPNHPIEKAEALAEKVTEGFLGGAMGPSDIDHFSFKAEEGDVVSVDINSFEGGQQPFDSWVRVYDSEKNVICEEVMDPTFDFTKPFEYWYDAFIPACGPLAEGTYTIGVSSTGRGFEETFYYSESGDYVMTVDGVLDEKVRINIEVKPGSEERAPINPKSKGKIPVALLGSDKVDVFDINVSSLRFGKLDSTGDALDSSVRDGNAKCDWTRSYINDDMYADRVCHFDVQATGFESGDGSMQGIVTGKTNGGVAFQGTGPLKVMPEKPKGQSKR